jgi:hypothetical protein
MKKKTCGQRMGRALKVNPMKRFEYKVLSENDISHLVGFEGGINAVFPFDKLEQEYNKLGQEGWRLVISGMMADIFIREKE